MIRLMIKDKFHFYAFLTLMIIGIATIVFAIGLVVYVPADLLYLQILCLLMLVTEAPVMSAIIYNGITESTHIQISFKK